MRVRTSRIGVCLAIAIFLGGVFINTTVAQEPTSTAGSPEPTPTESGQTDGPEPSSSPEATPESTTQPEPTASAEPAPEPSAESTPAPTDSTTGPAGPEPQPEAASAADETPTAPEQTDLDLEMTQPSRIDSKDGVIVAVVSNLGGQSEATMADVTIAGGDVTETQRVNVPPLAPGESWEIALPDTARKGLLNIAVVVDPNDAVLESDETNNAGETWLEIRHKQKVEGEAPITFRNQEGEAVQPEDVKIKEADGEITVSVKNGDQPIVGYIPKDWTESRLGPIASVDQSTQEVTEAGVSYLRFEIPAAGWNHLSLVAFDPKTEKALFGRGSIDSLILDERSMSVRLVQTPGIVQEEVEVTTGNGTETRVEERVEKTLIVDFDDGDSTGQDVWINADWLARFGIMDPVFAYEDGAEISADALEGFFVVHAPHFSYVYIYDYNPSQSASWYKYDFPSDDVAKHVFSITASQKANLQNAWLDVWARASSCSTSGNSFNMLFNGVIRTSFDPCQQWSTTDVGWYRFSLDKAWITDPTTGCATTCTVEFIKTAPGWLDRNILFYYTPTSVGKSTMKENGVTKTGELVWTLLIEINSPPPATTLRYPGSGATVPTHIVLDWDDVSDPDGDWVIHKLYHGTNSNPSWIGYNLYQADFDLWGTHGTTYWWKVCTTDLVTGHADQCTSVRSYTMMNQGPSSVSLQSPTNGLTNVNPTVTLTWTGGNDPDGDTVWYTIWRGPTSSSLQAIDSATSQSYTFQGSGLTTYWWRITANDNLYSHSDVWSNGPWSFTTKNIVNPNKPVPTAPSNGLTSAPFRQTFSWTGGHPNGQEVYYNVYYRQTGTYSWNSACSWVGSTSCTVDIGYPYGAVMPNTQYQWYIYAFNSNQDGGYNSNEDAPWTFTTKTNNAPTSINPVTPTAGATNVLWTITAQFSAGAPDAEDWHTYKVYRRTYPGGVNSQQCSDISSSYSGTFTCGQSWSNIRGQQYEWRVVASDRFGASTTGGPWTYTAKPNTPPSACPTVSVSQYLTVIGANNCTDPDGDLVKYTFTWSDGYAETPTGFISGTPPTKTHTFSGPSYCPDASVTLTVKAEDNYNGASTTTTSSPSTYISDVGHDVDGDGLIFCREAIQGTSDSSGSTDNDGDGLSDYVESQWWPNRNTVFCISGAHSSCAPNPRHKDVYIELDAVSTPAANLPSSATLDAVVAVFASSPISNPDGGVGVTAHFDLGATHAVKYNLKRGGDDIGSFAGNFATDCLYELWSNYDDARATYRDAARATYWHYGLFTERVCPGAGGVARGIPHHEFIMESAGSETDRQAVLMHEFGHVIGFYHGGWNAEPNHKPNYFSVMNYRMPFLANGNRFLGYSSMALQSMNEASLNENYGYGQDWGYLTGTQSTYLASFKVWFHCPGGDTFREFTAGASGKIDFNCNNVIDSGTVKSNINGHTKSTSANQYTGKKVGSKDDHGNAQTPVADDCTSVSTGGCDWMSGANDWWALLFDGLTHTNSYGAWDSTAKIDNMPMMDMSTPTCVSWIADGGKLCTG